MRACSVLVLSCLLAVAGCASSDGGQSVDERAGPAQPPDPAATSSATTSAGGTRTNTGFASQSARFAAGTQGGVAWTASLPGGTYAAAMPNGHVVVSGAGGTTELDAAGVVVRVAPWGGRVAVDGANEVFVAAGAGTLTEYDASWAPAWTATLGDTLVDVAADAAGEPVVVGATGAVTRFDHAGHARWTVAVPGAVGAAMDDAGDVFVLANDAGAVVVERLGDAGAVVWNERYAGDGAQFGRFIAADGAGDVTVTGLWRGTIDFGGGPMTFQGCCEGQGLKGFLVELDVSGTLLYATSHDRYFLGGLAVDPGGNAAVGGEFSDSPRSPAFSVFDRGGHTAGGGGSYGASGAGLGTLTALAADAQGAVVEVVATDAGAQVTKFVP